MTVSERRERKFAVELDQILQENVDCYVDEVGNPLPCSVTEEDVYRWIMEDDEYHLLTSGHVKNMIHMFMTDFRARMSYLRDNMLL